MLFLGNVDSNFRLDLISYKIKNLLITCTIFVSLKYNILFYHRYIHGLNIHKSIYTSNINIISLNDKFFYNVLLN